MRPEKAAIAEAFRQHLSDAEFMIFADYHGLTVQQAEDLRGRLARVETTMMVIRNRQFAHVAREMDFVDLAERVAGPTAIFYGSGDVVEASKILRTFARETKLPVIKLGTLEGKVLSGDDVNELAQLPSRDVLLAQVVGTIAAPMTQVVGVMQQKVTSLLYVLQAAADKKSN